MGLLYLVGVFALVGLVYLLLGFPVHRRITDTHELALQSFPKVAIQAKSAYVYDVRTKTVLYAKNENARLPLASLTKIMSAVVAEDLSPLYSTITIRPEALEADGDSGLLRDEEWSLKNLLDFSLVTSSNDGMRAVALALGALNRSSSTPEAIVEDFVREMNKKAGALGLNNTYFWNETGLDLASATLPSTKPEAIQEGAYGSARDVAVLVEYVIESHPEILAATREATSIFYSRESHAHLAKNTNILVGELPGLLGSKTGYTTAAGGNLVVALDPEIGRPIVIAILGSTNTGRFEDMRRLVNATLNYISEN